MSAMNTAAPARQKASSRNVKPGVYLLDAEDAVLYEVLDCRNQIVKVGQHGIPCIGEVRLSKVTDDWPAHADDEAALGAWCPFEEVVEFEVVVPAA